MKFTRESIATLTIRSVSRAGILINEQLWSAPVALTPDEMIESWTAVELADLVIDDFDVVLAAAPELVIVGSGANGQFPPRELTFAFARRGIGFEVMGSAAAARTFNVLAGEARRVVAILYPE